jgi:hypothetical protein
MFSIIIQKNEYKQLNTEIPHEIGDSLYQRRRRPYKHLLKNMKEDQMLLTFELEKIYKDKKVHDVYLFMTSLEYKDKTIILPYKLYYLFTDLMRYNSIYNIECISLFDFLLENIVITETYSYDYSRNNLYFSILLDYKVDRLLEDDPDFEYNSDFDILNKPEYAICILNKISNMSFDDMWNFLQTGMTEKYIEYLYKIKSWTGLETQLYERLIREGMLHIISFNSVKTFIYIIDEMKVPFVALDESLCCALAYNRLELADEIYKRMDEPKKIGIIESLYHFDICFNCKIGRNKWFNNDTVDWLEKHINNKTLEIDGCIYSLFKLSVLTYNKYLYDKIVVNLIVDIKDFLKKIDKERKGDNEIQNLNKFKEEYCKE